MKPGIRKLGDTLYADEDRIKQTLKAHEDDTGEKIEIDPAILKDFWDKGAFDIVMKRNASLSIMLDHTPQYARYLALMDWLFVIAPKNYSFITTDSPFVLVPTSDSNVTSPFGNCVGLLVPGVQKYFPVSQKICLIIADRGSKTQYSKQNKFFCQSINIHLARHAKRFIIARDRPLLLSLVKNQKLDKGQRPETLRIHNIGPHQIFQNIPIQESE